MLLFPHWKKMPFTNFKEKDEYYTQAKRAKNTQNVCYDCEQVFQPIRNGQKFCTKCFKYARSTSKSIALNHSYLRNNRGQSSSCIGKSSVGVRLDQSKLVPEYRPSFNSVVVVPTSSSLIHHREPNSNLANQQPKSGPTQLKVKKVAVAINTEKEAQSSRTKDAVKRPSGVLLAEIDLSTSSCDESDDGDKKQQQVTCIENIAPSHRPTTSYEKEIGDSCPSESHLLTKQSNTISDFSHSTPLLESNNPHKKFSELKDNPACLSIQINVQPDIPNQLGFANLKLDELRVKEEELKQVISSHTLYFDEISSVQKRIIELKSRHSAGKEILLRKKGDVKSHKLKVCQTRSVVEAIMEEKHSLFNQIKKANSAVELARSSCDSTQMGVNETKRKLGDAKDEVIRDYLLTILAKKEERAKAAEAKVKYTVTQLDETKEYLQKIEEDLITKEAALRELSLQSEKAKSVFISLRDDHALTDQEIKLAHSQMNSLMQANNQTCFEHKRQLLEVQRQIESLEYERKLESEKNEFQRLLEIKFDVKIKELDTEREFKSQLLSLKR